MKNILTIVGDPVGGIRRHIHDLLLHNDSSQFRFHYIHGDNPDSRAVDDFRNLDNQGVLRSELKIKKEINLTDFINLIKIIYYCKKNRINLIHGHGAKGGFYSRLAGFFAGIPSIYTPHGGVVHPIYSKISTLLYRSIEFFLKFITSFYIFESCYTKNSFISFVGGVPSHKYMVNYGGISIDHNTLDDNNRSNELSKYVNILVVGMLREIKGQSIVIRALSEIKRTSDLHFKVHFCGDGPDKSKLIALVNDSGLEDCITFHGDVANIAPYYAMCNVVVIPSLHESFGYVALEAVSLGRPVIASHVGGLREVIIDNFTGYSFSAGDHIGLASKLLELLSSKENTLKYSNNAKLFIAKKFNLSKQLSILMSIYYNLLIPISSK